VTASAPIDLVLTRLERPRQRAKGQWSACCPAHKDRSPSLSVRELDDGCVLLKCHAECTIEQVVGALGLDLTDLFPPREPPPGAGTTPERRRRLLTAGQALELLESEALLVASSAATLAAGHALTDADLDRLLTASARVTMLREEVRA
jgi:hypothetical protein